MKTALLNWLAVSAEFAGMTVIVTSIMLLAVGFAPG